MNEFAPGVVQIPILFVNAYFIGEPGDAWVLVDSGIPGKADYIRTQAEARYGKGSRPSAIVLTHGHFDHAGSALELAQSWDVPIYAHHLELPYLTGRSNFPPQDPTVGGAIAFMSRFFPHTDIDLDGHVHEFENLEPEDDDEESGAFDGESALEISELPGWEIYHVPGHAPGQIALFRPSDQTLIAGDALATMNMDSWLGMLTKKRGLWRAGAPFNYDWEATRESVQFLAELRPKFLGCGHGNPIANENLPNQFQQFADTFEEPEHGRYVIDPAHINEKGVVSVPPPAPDSLPKIAAGIAVAGLTLFAFSQLRRRNDD